ncbi:MAG TPA: hypothetical protein VFP90_16265 [Gemmatimonadaceae bacterium]|nr:hypothetical protein [Gemmatimonadaceae bacterium]
MPASAAPADAGVLWLAALQRALGRAAHDVKDALNGVSVNLEVVRSRAGRAEAPASAVAPFAEAAAQQLERLTALLDTVLSLGRSERAPVDLSVTLRRVASLCGASSTATDARVVVRDLHDGDARTSVVGDAVRLALAAPLLDAVVGARSALPDGLECELTGEPDSLVVRLRTGRPVTIAPDVAEAIRLAGVRWTEDAAELSLFFPRA